MPEKRTPISLLELPPDEDGERDYEMYFWYGGNPFGLERKRDAIVAMEGQLYQTQPVEDSALELARAIYDSSNLGYLVARKNYLVVRVPAETWHPTSHKILEFFPSNLAIVSLVQDRKGKMAGSNHVKRMKRVVETEGYYGPRKLDPIQLHIPDRLAFGRPPGT